MRKFILLLLISFPLCAQNLDSLFSEVVEYRSNIKTGLTTTRIESHVGEKCGFGLLAAVKQYFPEFTKQQQNIISGIFARPQLSKSIVSPSGFFRIHFDESGPNKPEYNIGDLAAAFDSAYNYEVNILGYPSPPPDESLGGDDKYDIYILDLGGGLYGATTPETTSGQGKYISYIEIDNSFNKNEGYNSFGIDGAKVTAAHEFHHAIQLGSYIFRSEDTYYYELTSTAFEEFVFDDVNDYYAYMSSYFRNPSNKLENNSGYNLAIWNLFLQQKFNDEDPMLGHEIVKRSWENIVKDRAIIAIARAIESLTDLSFAQLFNEFGDWMYFTDTRAKSDQFFEEAANYPMVRSNYSLDLNNFRIISFESQPTSINFLTFYDYSRGFADTVVAVLSNSDIYGSISGNNNQMIEFTISNAKFENSFPINELFFSKIESQKVEVIQASYIINNELSDVAIERKEIEFVYPQPFNYEIADILNIPTYPDPSNSAELRIFSADMNLVYSGEESIVANQNIVVRWDGRDNDGNKLASGVYVFVTKANGKIKKGKFVIFN